MDVFKKPAAAVHRRQTRPIGEFGGNLGCMGWTFFIPTCIWYLYGCMVMHHGKLAIPDYEFWYDLFFTLPDGLAIRPTWEAMRPLRSGSSSRRSWRFSSLPGLTRASS